MRAIAFRTNLVVAVIILIIGAFATARSNASNMAASDTLFYDDFEDGILFDKWVHIEGNWGVIDSAGNLLAHLARSSTHWRRIVSKDPVPADTAVIYAKVKGVADDPPDPSADMAVGFYSNKWATRFYHITLGGDNSAIEIYRFEDGVQYPLAVNHDVLSYNDILYNVKIMLESANIHAKRWAVGTDEPPDWQISYAGADPEGGYYVVLGGIQGQDYEEFWFDDVIIVGTRIPIPTLTEWGLIILVVSIVFITWVFLRRRKTVVNLQ